MKTLNSEELWGLEYHALDLSTEKIMKNQVEFKVLFLSAQKMGDEVLHQVGEEVKSKIRDEVDENTCD